VRTAESTPENKFSDRSERIWKLDQSQPEVIGRFSILWSNYGPVIVSQWSENRFWEPSVPRFSISYYRIGYCHGKRPRVRVPSSPPFLPSTCPRRANSRGHKKAQNRHNFRACFKRRLPALAFSEGTKARLRLLAHRVSPLYCLGVGVECYADRQVKQ
jgi:hypothetical protein